MDLQISKQKSAVDFRTESKTLPGKKLLTKDIGGARREQVHGNEEHSLSALESEAPTIRVGNVPSSVMKSDLASLKSQIGHRDNGTVHLSVLEDKLKRVPIVLLVLDVDLSEVRRQAPCGALVRDALALPLRLLNGMVGERDLAVSHSGL